MRYNVQPSEYYAYCLWKPNRKVNIDNYLYSREGPRVFKLLNQPSDPNPIDDKLVFHQMCKAHAIPSPEILAAFTPTGNLLEFQSGGPPKRDLWVKPRIGLASEGAEHFRWQSGVFESDRGFRLRREDFCDYLATRARTESRTFLVQPALSNHPKLRTGANAYLATARLVTGLSTDGTVTPIFGHIYIFHHFAGTNQLLDRQVALIDVASGRLTWWPREIAGKKRWNRLDNNRSDGVRLLPDWHTVLRYTKVAHQACPSFVFVGWDAAFAEDGPVLLEGNANWSAGDYQRLSDEPLGCTKFADILATRLRDSEGLSFAAQH
jgi:hypothetical protein